MFLALQNEVEVRASYVIKAKPEASLTFKRLSGGRTRVDSVAIKVDLEEVIPTVALTTSFEGFESIVLGGRYSSLPETGDLEGEVAKHIQLHLTVNSHRILHLNSKVVLRDSSAKVLCGVKVLLLGRDLDHRLKASASWEEPYELEVTYQDHENEVYSLSADASPIKNEFGLHLSTPFEGLESVVLALRTGTTSVGSSLGRSRRQRRSVGLELEPDAFSLHTPLSLLRSLKLRRTKRGVSVEQSGENGLLANISVDYDFDCGDNNVGLKVRGVKPPEIAFAFSLFCDESFPAY